MNRRADPGTSTTSSAWNFLPNVIEGASNIAGAVINSNATAGANAANAALQREFAQHGLSWRIADARRAGIHPLAALGGNFAQASPSYVGDTSGGDLVKSLGQNVSRALAVSQNEAQRRMMQLQLMSLEADVEGKTIDNQIRAHRLKTLSGGPPFPGSDNFVPGQSGSGLVTDKPLERTVSQPGRLAQEAGWRPDVSYSRTDTGLVPMIPESLSESLEDDVIGKLMWRVRNQLMPNVSVGTKGKPARSQLPKGATDWRWSYSRQEWYPFYRTGRGSSGSWKGGK